MTGANSVSVASAKILTGLLKFYFLILAAQICSNLSFAIRGSALGDRFSPASNLPNLTRITILVTIA